MPCKVSVQVIEVHHLIDQFPEVHVRTPRWFSQRDAAAVVGDAGLRVLLRSARAISA